MKRSNDQRSSRSRSPTGSWAVSAAAPGSPSALYRPPVFIASASDSETETCTLAHSDEAMHAASLLAAVEASLCELKDSRNGKKLAQTVSALKARLTDTVQSNAHLRHRVGSQQARLELLMKEEACIVQRSVHIRASASSSSTPNRMPGTAGAAAAKQPALSVSSLPDPADWSVAWEERVLSLNALDLLQLRRCWLTDMAMLLPKAQCEGPGSPSYAALVTACDSFMCFNQRAMTLIPEQWTLHTKYNMETLEPFEAPSQEFMAMFLGKRPDNGPMQAILNESLSTLRALRSEYDALCAEHRQLAADVDDAVASSYWAGSSSSEQACDTSAAMDGLLQRMQGNLHRQHMVTKQATFAVYKARRERHCADVVHASLVFFPLPIDTVHYLEAFL